VNPLVWLIIFAGLFFRFMRLGQLARQLNVSPKEIIRKLEKDFDTEIKSHPNAKIPDEHLENLMQAFGYTENEKIDEGVEETPEPEIKETKKTEIVEKLIEIVESVEQNTEDTEPAPGKVELDIPALDGPKIVGKIDLPESELNRVIEKKEERPVRTKRPKKRPVEDRKRKHKTKKVESLEDKRKREHKEIESQRKKSAESLKDFNKKKYEEKTKSNGVVKVKSKKSKKKKVEAIRTQQAINEVKVTKKKPTSLVGKLWSWLNDA
tara:strand:- start:8685 stop:9479 length:795 start_codon:yes stop_codon:yes gene_type:complete